MWWDAACFCDQWKHQKVGTTDNGHTFLWKGRSVGFVALKKKSATGIFSASQKSSSPKRPLRNKKQQIHGACSLKKWWQAGWPRVVLGFPAVGFFQVIEGLGDRWRQPRSADQPRSHGPVTPLSFKSTGALIEFKGMDQYLLIPFLGGWTSINPSYFDVNKRGTRFWHTAIWWPVLITDEFSRLFTLWLWLT